MAKKTVKSEDVIDAEFEPVDEVHDQKMPRKRAAWPLVWFLFLLATVFGAVGGVAGMQFVPNLLPQKAAIVNPKIAELAAQIKTLQNQPDPNIELTELQAQMSELLQRPLPKDEAIDENILANIADLGARIEQLETTLPPVLQADGEQVQLDLAPLLNRLEKLEQQAYLPQEIPDFSTDITSLANAVETRLQALENAPLTTIEPQILRSVQERLQNLETVQGSNSIQAERAIALADLKLASQSSRPFAVAFAQARLRFGASNALDQLTRIADNGAPTLTDLSKELTQLIPLALSQANAPADDASLRTKAAAAMRSLVSVRRTDGKGEGLQVDLAQAEAALQRGDLSLAIQKIEAVNNPTLRNWLQQAKDRQTTQQSLIRLEQELATGVTP